jgi:hypothetical protein
MFAENPDFDPVFAIAFPESPEVRMLYRFIERARAGVG